MPNLSHTQVELLRPGGCSQQHWFKYHPEGKRLAATVQSLLPIHFGFGSAVHSGIEFGLRHKMEYGEAPDIEEVLAAFDRAWGAEAQKANLDWGRATPAQLRSNGHKLLRLFFTEVAPQVAVPLGVERKISVPIPDRPGWSFMGYLDFYGYDTQGRLIVWDAKTTSSGRVWNQVKADHEGQPLAYAWLMGQADGVVPDGFVFVPLIQGLWGRECRVATIETRRTEAQLDAYEDLLRYAVDHIGAGLRIPNPDFTWHSNCPFRGLCTPWELEQPGDGFAPGDVELIL